MLRNYWTLLVLLGIALNSFAQDEKNLYKGLSFNFLVGVPVGKFVSVDRTDDESGYAEIGFGFDVNYRVMNRSKPFGAIFTIRYLSFNYDVDAVVGYLASAAPPGLWYGEGENWKMTSVMTGGFVDIIHSERFSLEVRAQAGYLRLQAKNRYISGIGSGGTYNIIISYQNKASSSFSYLFGLGIKARMSPKVFFSASLEYFGAAPNVDYSYKMTSAAVVVQSSTGTFTQPINALLISTGFVFIF